MPDVVIAKLDAALEATPSSPDALPLAERAPWFAEIEVEIALLESREEAVLKRALRDGVVIERRFDHSPAFAADASAPTPSSPSIRFRWCGWIFG